MILQTKIKPPPLRAEHTPRPRLTTAIKPDARFVLVSAPAGFGKSALLAEWTQELEVVHWLALDARDNDPARFAAYLLAACGLKTDENINLLDAVDHLLNHVADSERQHTLILDDYHLITEPRIHDALGRLLEYTPPNLRVAIGTRADPPLQLARLRAGGDISEIRLADLGFREDEITAWLGWQPSARVRQRLYDLTEGWAAALGLIMMALDSQDDSALEKQLAHYSQAGQHIFDYFAQEVLAQQPDEVQDFLLDTCILNWFDPDLCRALTDSKDAPRLLNQLTTESFFVIRLSDDAPHYRYHHLFEGFLRQYLTLHDELRYLEQHRRAAAWHAEKGEIVEAVEHALSAEAYDFAAELIRDRAWEKLTSRGEITTLLGWLGRFPQEALQAYPRLCLYFSRALYLTGDMVQSEALLDLPAGALQGEDLRAIAHNYRATLAAYRGDIGEALHWDGLALEGIEALGGVDRVRVANTNAYLQYLIGDVPSAQQAYKEALSLAEAIGHAYLTLDAHFYLARLDLLSGDLDAVKTRCEGLLDEAQQRIAPLSTIMLPLALMHYHRNQLTDAEATLNEALRLAERGNIPDVLWFAHLALADVYLAQGKHEQTLLHVQQAEAITQSYRSPMLADYLSATTARIKLPLGERGVALRWAEDYASSGGYQRDAEDLILAQVWLFAEKPEAALSVLDNLIPDAQAGQRWGYVLMAEALRSLAYDALTDDENAAKSLQRALDIAQRGGFIRPFLELDKPMLDLLENHPHEHARKILDHATQDDIHPADKLTERELEVLTLIATGASNQDIADELVLTVGTVKSHIHRIMGKLGAGNRLEAVNKARNLNLL